MMKKVLILSNHMDYDLLFSKIFEVEGHKALVVPTVQEVLSLLRKSEVDIMVMILPLNESE